MRPIPGGAFPNDYAPEFWPDGKRILFTTDRAEDGTDQLFSIPTAGGDPERFTHAPGSWIHGRVAPDSSYVACIGNADGHDAVYLLDLNGVPVRQLTSGGDGGFERLAWSPDSSRLVFPWRVNGRRNLWVADVASGELHLLLDEATDQGSADWSPDGEWIAFMSRDTSPNLYRIRPDGTDLQCLTTGGAVEWWPSYSPGATSIAYWAGNGPHYDLYVMTADGRRQRALTQRWDWNWSPSWSPSGELIAFDSRHDGRRGIWVMKPDGTGQRKLTSPAPSDFAVCALAHGPRRALARLAYSRRCDPEATFVSRHETAFVVRSLLERGELYDALLLADWNLGEHPDQTDAADLWISANRRASRSTPPTTLELISLFRHGRVSEALQLYDQARADYPGWPAVSANWMRVPIRELVANSQFGDAVRVADAALGQDPDAHATRSLLAAALAGAGELERAEVEARTVLEHEPRDRRALEVLAELAARP